MRFSTYLLAAGLSATAFAAPVAVDTSYDECEADPAPSSSAVAVATAAALSTSIVPTTAAAAVATPSASSSAAAVATPSVVSSAAAVASPSTSSSAAAVAVTSSSAAAVATSATSSAAAAATSSSSTSGITVSGGTNGTMYWLGVSESGAEFGQTVLPGTLGTDYTWPNTTAIQTLIDLGMNVFRIPILMERISPTSITGALDTTYLADLKTVVNYVTAAGSSAVIDMHNYGRYNGATMSSTSDFQTFWNNVATEFATNDLVIFDCNNEYHDMPTNTIVAELNQACIDGIRAAGATSQYIFVEGTSYTGAWTWTTSGNSEYMGNITDPENKVIYEMHQYLDSDGSGTSGTCVSSTIGAERLAAATTWLRENNKIGVLGEFAGGANTVCETAVTGMLDFIKANSDVWMGALWWAAGPWWGSTYFSSMEPATGEGFVAYKDILAKYAPTAA
ncbi:hypothetical protein BP5796_04188 [Coleophoma crateriformis]|uniref:cellulase n=1 Tax=Coleophoma crateriformis TaxID=565419 RepID=A0A3D8SHT7_9HELO|nr:hypothetical protein BP5796_04188 [Coleophoma crateriformis]